MQQHRAWRLKKRGAARSWAVGRGGSETATICLIAYYQTWRIPGICLADKYSQPLLTLVKEKLVKRQLCWSGGSLSAQDQIWKEYTRLDICYAAETFRSLSSKAPSACHKSFFREDSALSDVGKLAAPRWALKWRKRVLALLATVARWLR
jgi:hypothetical protein